MSNEEKINDRFIRSCRCPASDSRQRSGPWWMNDQISAGYTWFLRIKNRPMRACAKIRLDKRSFLIYILGQKECFGTQFWGKSIGRSPNLPDTFLLHFDVIIIPIFHLHIKWNMMKMPYFTGLSALLRFRWKTAVSSDVDALYNTFLQKEITGRRFCLQS